MAWFKATDEHEACSNFINWHSPKEASGDNQQAIQEEPVEMIDSGGTHQGEPENSISWNSSIEASIDNQQAIQEHPVELIDGGATHQDEPESWPSLIHKETRVSTWL